MALKRSLGACYNKLKCVKSPRNHFIHPQTQATSFCRHGKWPKKKSTFELRRSKQQHPILVPFDRTWSLEFKKVSLRVVVSITSYAEKSQHELNSTPYIRIYSILTLGFSAASACSLSRPPYTYVVRWCRMRPSFTHSSDTMHTTYLSPSAWQGLATQPGPHPQLPDLLIHSIFSSFICHIQPPQCWLVPLRLLRPRSS